MPAYLVPAGVFDQSLLCLTDSTQHKGLTLLQEQKGALYLQSIITASRRPHKSCQHITYAVGKPAAAVLISLQFLLIRLKVPHVHSTAGSSAT
jgi:hypothetical protein